MTTRRTAILLPLGFLLGSCELRAPAGTSAARAVAAETAAVPSIESAERWSPPAPLLAYTLDAPLEREACSATDQRHKLQGVLDRSLVKVAGEQLNLPLGSGRYLPVKGRRYLFCLEQHYRAPGSGRGPTGWHKGVTVYSVPTVETAELGRGLGRSG